MTEVNPQKSKDIVDKKKTKKTITFNLLKNPEDNEEIKEFLKTLINTSSHFGDSNLHASVKKQKIIVTKKHGCNIINLNKILQYLQNALNIVCNIIANDGKVLFFFPEDNEFGEMIKNTAIECNQFYIIGRWDPGSFTNFGEILKKHNKVKNVQNIYFANKKEKSVFEKKIERSRKYISGITNMYDLPNAVVTIINPKSYVLLKEAQAMKIPVVGFMDVNENMNSATYPVPINIKSPKTLELICYLLKKCVFQGYENNQSNKEEKILDIKKQSLKNIEKKMVEEVIEEKKDKKQVVDKE
ncbi:30S ribosomal protein S2 [Rickettsiales bacterium (ex Bugula neritina AB1)]|nr:30S ribosomal protein S2 [Rickettsiales bacterium (ex Bugula neritina AB1)]